MNITATYNGNPVTIVGISTIGSEILVSYVDASSILHVDKIYIPISLSTIVIATNCTVVS